MAPKRNAAAAPSPSIIPPSTAKPSHGQTSASSQPTKPIAASVKPTSVKSTVRNSSDAQEIALAVWDRYVKDTPQRVKLIDVFMTFLVLVGVLQFAYCVIGGNYVCSSPVVAFSIHD
jgi:oligosaccharyltransferase complex subunit epsilon